MVGGEVLLQKGLDLPLVGAERGIVGVAEGEERVEVERQGLKVTQLTDREQQVEAADVRVWVLRPEQAGPGVKGLLVEPPRALEVAVGFEGAGEVLESAEGVGVLRAENAGPSIEGLLEAPPCALEVAMGHEGEGEVIEGGEGVGVLRAEPAGPGVEGLLV